MKEFIITISIIITIIIITILSSLEHSLNFYERLSRKRLKIRIWSLVVGEVLSKPILSRPLQNNSSSIPLL
jgi:hypothetical protein